MRTILDEWTHILRGKFVILILIVPLVVAAVFGYIFQNGTVNEASLAVVDQDHSLYSRQLLSKLDASQYLQVNGVFDNYFEADQLLYNEKYSGVLYLPAGLEAAYLQGKPVNVGLYLDMTLTASASSIRTGVSEVIGMENGTKTGTSPLTLEQRSLYNPTSQTVMSSVMMFVNVVLLVLLGINTITIVPRLREQGKLEEELRHPVGIVLRVVPYALLGCISCYLVIGALKQLGGLRFEAHVLQIFLPFFLYTLCTCLLAMLIGWTAPVPSKATGRIVMLIMPSFLLSGGQVPVALLPELLQWVNKAIPLSLHFQILRGLGYKGGDVRYFIPELGHYLILISVILLGIFFLVVKEWKRQSNEQAETSSPIVEPAGNS
ncbi:ABC transporter permease [Brevibacillus nitrificans]|uniref:ABC transporter permease n=1 Tax=Brevibacillus nitrificans TaxID=651560 RepID=UPI002855C900|nr:ABC transporter permease [Brevibacillus nitrificans]MDR7319412.1 ABC-2 type transport system permease protein [Brevibacillus nitrificans]